MRIENVITNATQKSSNRLHNLKAGDVLGGKILDKKGDVVTIQLSDGTSIEGKTHISLDKFVGSYIKLLVKEVTDSSLVFTPLSQGVEEGKGSQVLIKSLLDEIGLIDNQKNKEILQILLDYKMPINNGSIDKISILLDKLEGIVNLANNEEVELVSRNANPLDEDISRLLINKAKTDLPTENRFKGTNITNIIKESINSAIPNGEVDINIIKRVAFLLKNNIKVNINNLSFLNEILSNKDFLEKDIINIIEAMDKEGFDTNHLRDEFTKFTEGKTLNFDSSDKETLKQSLDKLLRFTEKLQNQLQGDENKSQTLLEKANILNNKLVFLNNLNQNSTLYYIPFKVPRRELEGKLMVMNKRRKRHKEDKLRVFISLNTTNLKTIDVMVESGKSTLSLNFRVQSKEILSFLKDRNNELESLLSGNGYESISIRYKIKDEDPLEPLDVISDENSHNYLLDIRV